MSHAGEGCGCQASIRIVYQPLHISLLVSPGAHGTAANVEMNVQDGQHRHYFCRCNTSEEQCVITFVVFPKEAPDVRFDDSDLDPDGLFQCVWAVSPIPEPGDHWVCDNATCNTDP